VSGKVKEKLDVEGEVKGGIQEKLDVKEEEGGKVSVEDIDIGFFFHSDGAKSLGRLRRDTVMGFSFCSRDFPFNEEL